MSRRRLTELGRFNHFQGGSIYWNSRHRCARESTAPSVTSGPRWDLSVRFSGTRSPTSPRRRTELVGSTIFRADRSTGLLVTGAHEVHGAIRDKWAAMGFESSFLGYPTTDEQDIPGGRISHFVGGAISRTPSAGAVLHPGITLRAVVDQGRSIEVTGIGFSPSQGVKLGYDIRSGGAPTTHQHGEDVITSDNAGKIPPPHQGKPRR